MAKHPRRPNRAPRNSITVELERPTPVTVAALDDALDRIPGRRSLVRDGVLHLHPDEAEQAIEALAEHARQLVRVNRAANSYRDVQLRRVRKAIEAATSRTRKGAAA